MIRIGRSKDLEKLKTDVPVELKTEVHGVIKLLDESYGETRDIDKDLGGYALIIEDQKDINKCSKLGITFDDTYIPEYVLLILPNEGEPYTQSLFLANDDYAIVIFMPLKLTPQYIINMIER